MKLKKIATLAAGALAMLATPMATQARDEYIPPQKGQERLAKMLKGRTAGKPQNCIRQFPSSRMTVIDGTAIVFRDGSTLWVNYTKRPKSIDDSDTLVIRKYGGGTQLCRTDIINTVDRGSGIDTGNVFLSEFIPYRKS